MIKITDVSNVYDAVSIYGVKWQDVAIEVLTAVTIKSSVFLGITPCIPLKVSTD
jgi:hypothetical protein